MRKLVTIFFVSLIAVPAFCGQMYEWRDPSTGKLQLGDKPPAGIQHWKEGEKRPEEKAEELSKDSEKKAAQERLDATEKAEHDRKILAEVERMRKLSEEIEKVRKEKCTGDPSDLGVKIGMTSEIFRMCFGVDPDTINVTTTAAGTREQWVYRSSTNNHRYFYFTNGILTAIQK